MILIGSSLQLPEWSEALRMEPSEIYDVAILGYDPLEDRLIYSEDKVIDLLVTKEEMPLHDALEWYEYNINGSKGDNHPIYIIPNE
jgi:hypothetical protein|tara:strand:- start:1730 stop:1987 length:258 start_codon:yes stop_codon:yes gene_type:complete